MSNLLSLGSAHVMFWGTNYTDKTCDRRTNELYYRAKMTCFLWVQAPSDRFSSGIGMPAHVTPAQVVHAQPRCPTCWTSRAIISVNVGARTWSSRLCLYVLNMKLNSTHKRKNACETHRTAATGSSLSYRRRELRCRLTLPFWTPLAAPHEKCLWQHSTDGSSRCPKY